MAFKGERILTDFRLSWPPKHLVFLRVRSNAGALGLGRWWGLAQVPNTLQGYRPGEGVDLGGSLADQLIGECPGPGCPGQGSCCVRWALDSPRMKKTSPKAGSRRHPRGKLWRRHFPSPLCFGLLFALKIYLQALLTQNTPAPSFLCWLHSSYFLLFVFISGLQSDLFSGAHSITVATCLFCGDEAMSPGSRKL